MDINVSGLINNIYYVAKIRGKKIGELESNAGVTPGYLSRFLKNGVQGVPNLEVIFSMAKQLNVSLDSLLFEKYTEINETDKYLIESINSLTNKTRKREIIWETQCRNYIFNLGIESGCNELLVDHPLAIVKRENGRLHIYYWSFFTSESSKTFENIYMLKKGESIFYLSLFYDKNNKENYELYRYGPIEKRAGCIYELTNVCNAIQGVSKDSLYLAMKILYEACNVASKTPYVSKDVEMAIEELLSNDK